MIKINKVVLLSRCVLVLFLIFSLYDNLFIVSSLTPSDSNGSVYLQENALLFNETAAYNHIESQLDFGFRVPGTSDHFNCSKWINDQISIHVDETIQHNFTIQKENQSSYSCQNILGKLNTEKDNIVILASHWDSRNVAEKDYFNQSLPIPGANDGASGVGVLIELARVLKLYQEYLDCEVWFLFLDAEDQGYSGGMYGLEGWNWAEGAMNFTENIDDFYNSQQEEIECFILLDMVGGFDLEFIQESRTNNDLHKAIFGLGQNLGYSVAFPENPKKMSITDDHVAFDEIGIPVIDLTIDFIAGNWTFHHTHSDNLSNIDTKNLKITGQTIEAFIKTYYAEGDNLQWNEGFFSNTFIVMSVIVFVLVAVFTVNFLRTKRRKS